MEEIEEIVISMFAIVLAFVIATGGLAGRDLFTNAVVLTFTIGVGFVSHELGHKYAAEKFGSASRFVMWTQGVIFMLLLSFTGFIFAAPGAVYIFKRMGKKENGIVSLAGPAINMLLFLFFATVLVGSGAFNIGLSQVVMAICIIGMQINALLATFNLLPIFILDGAKVFNWDWRVWGAAFLVAIGMSLSVGIIAGI